MGIETASTSSTEQVRINGVIQTKSALEAEYLVGIQKFLKQRIDKLVSHYSE